MTTYAALAHTTWIGGYDWTGDTDTTMLEISYDELLVDVFGNTGHVRIAGLEDIHSSVKGPWQSATAGAVDVEAITGLSTGAVQVITQSPTGAELDVAWMYQARKFAYRPFVNKVGEVHTYELDIKSSDGGAGFPSVGSVDGRVLKGKGDVSATGAIGQGYQLGAVSADQYLYGTFHVFSPGTTITIVLESDDNAGFTTATTRATIGPLTAAGGTWSTRVAGAITDDYYRFRVTAITGTFSVAAAAGIK